MSFMDMDDKLAITPSIEVQQVKASPTAKKSRPPNLLLAPPLDDRLAVPGFGTKPGRRESRLGLRHLFGRSKALTQDDAFGLGNLASPNTAARFADIHPSVTNRGTRPYNATAVSTDCIVESEQESLPVFRAEERPVSSAGLSSRSKSSGAPKSRKLPRAAHYNEEAPPLFKAFPQAIRYATLPACAQNMDVILRLNEKKPENQSLEDARDEKTAKKHRKNLSSSAFKLEWTTKVYVLAASGRLFQYAGDGPFDRLPEKTMKLSKDSAAYASDVIPGKHWVLQVMSGAEPEAPTSPELRSLFSRFAFRSNERRETPQILMVFENAKDMEGWMTALRQQIAQLGGRLSQSDIEGIGPETLGASVTPLRDRTSQRTLTVQDSRRSSRASDQSRESHGQRNGDTLFNEGAMGMLGSERAHDGIMDDSSTLHSITSAEGRQLESLRDSNRLSFLSIGQRTAITSAGSSPTCSPTLGHFPTPPSMEGSFDFSTRMRSSPMDVAERRKSCHNPLQLADSVLDARNHAVQSPYSLSARSSVVSPTGSVPPPNFSVPASSAHRFSKSTLSDGEFSPTSPQTPETEPPAAAPRAVLRKSPPTSLRLSRPLSMVMDQPSPREPLPERPVTRHGENDSDLAAGMPALPRFPMGQFRSLSDLTPRRLSLKPTSSPPLRPVPRRLSSTGSLRKTEEDVMLPSQVEMAFTNKGVTLRPRRDTAERPKTFAELGYRRRVFSPENGRSSKRLSIHSVLPDGSIVETEVARVEDLPPPAAPPPNIALPPLPPAPRGAQLRLEPRTRGLLNRRSLPHLAADMAPPAPPPTCELPPIPVHLLGRTRS